MILYTTDGELALFAVRAAAVLTSTPCAVSWREAGWWIENDRIEIASRDLQAAFAGHMSIEEFLGFEPESEDAEKVTVLQTAATMAAERER